MPRRKAAPVVLMVIVVTLAASFAAAANVAPVARIAAYRASALSGYAVTYDGSSSSDSDGRVVRYQWLFGDGTTGSGSPVTHTYAQAAPVSVTLLVGDDGGATSLVTQVVDIAVLPTQAAAGTSGGTTPNLGATTPAAASTAPTGNDIGQRAPEIALPSISGGMVYLSAYLGRPVLVEFWLSTCPGCRASTAGLEEYRSRYAEQGLVVMLVVLDRSPSAAVSFFNEYGYDSFVLAWESDASKPTMFAYGVAVTPTAFLIDRTGVIRYAGHPSGLSEQFLTRWL